MIKLLGVVLTKCLLKSKIQLSCFEILNNNINDLLSIQNISKDIQISSHPCPSLEDAISILKKALSKRKVFLLETELFRI